MDVPVDDLWFSGQIVLEAGAIVVLCEHTPLFSPFVARKMMHILSSVLFVTLPQEMGVLPRLVVSCIQLAVVAKAALGASQLNKDSNRFDWGILLYGVITFVCLWWPIPYISLVPMFFGDPGAALAGTFAQQSSLLRSSLAARKTVNSKTVLGSSVMLLVTLLWAVLCCMSWAVDVWLQVIVAVVFSLSLTLVELYGGEADNLWISIPSVAYYCVFRREPFNAVALSCMILCLLMSNAPSRPTA